MSTENKFLRPTQAAAYLCGRYGLGTPRSLAKARCCGGGPIFHRLGRLVVYRPEDLDRWAQSRLSAPLRSTSDTKPVQRPALTERMLETKKGCGDAQ